MINSTDIRNLKNDVITLLINKTQLTWICQAIYAWLIVEVV